VSEIKNRTIMVMGRCLLFKKYLLKMFSAKVVNTSIFSAKNVANQYLGRKKEYLLKPDLIENLH